MMILTKDKAKNKMVLVGELEGDTFYKDVRQDRHYMRNNNSYGIQIEAFEQLVKRQYKKIIIREKDTGYIWETLMSDWITHGVEENYGHGKQKFLSLRWFNAKKLPENFTPSPEKTEETKKDQQSSLF